MIWTWKKNFLWIWKRTLWLWFSHDKGVYKIDLSLGLCLLQFISSSAYVTNVLSVMKLPGKWSSRWIFKFDQTLYVYTFELHCHFGLHVKTILKWKWDPKWKKGTCTKMNNFYYSFHNVGEQWQPYFIMYYYSIES